MDTLLRQKYETLQNAEDFECWYLVKQPTEFSSICYLVSILERYQNEHSSDVFQTYVESKIANINRERHLDISSNYRALRIAAFYGLIKMVSSSYQDSILTETYYEIKARCGGAFENISTYSDIIQRQIEKMYASTSIDEKFDSVRRNFRLYPVLFLYKILLEIGYATNNYSISMDEYRYLVATSTTYNKFLETLLLIQKWRDASDADRDLFSPFRAKFDNRFIQALKQLTTLNVDTSSGITLKRECVSEVAQKVFSFEKYLRNERFDDAKFVDFLCSKEWLVDEKTDDDQNADEENLSDEETKELPQIETPEQYNEPPVQIIYYGVPGCGKSYEVNKEIDGKLAGLQDKEYHKVRCVFHQEYSNADFVGQVYPFVEPGGHGVDYRFKPGPFAEVVRRAYREPNEPFFLIIEEINRGNAAAIFGEVFQLLDRIKPGDSPDESTENIYQPGWSSYGVSNADVNAYIRQKTVDEEEIRVLRQNHDSLYDEEINIQRDDCAHKVINGNVRTVRERELHFTWTTAIRLPPNISIYATMNTSDQNVSTMDNAFQRRLESKMIRNDLKNEAQYNIKIKGTNVYWGAFRDWVNEKILSTPGISKADDKCLGGWFISTAVEMKDAEGNVTKYEDIKREVFAEKVIKYLWDDVFKRNTAAEIFRKGTGNGEFKSLSELIDVFEKKNDDGSFRYVNLDAFDKVFKLSQEDKANLIKDINGVSAQDNPGNNAIAEGEPGVDA